MKVNIIAFRINFERKYFLGSPGAFLRSFVWNKMKYRVDEPVATIMNNIVEEVHQIDNVLKNKISTYHHAKSNLNSLNRKKTYDFN